MRFTLYYKGKLESNARPDRKHELRQNFHVQLAQLWAQAPLSQVKFLVAKESAIAAPSLIREVGGFRFAPLLTASYAAVAELKLTVLRPGTVGDIFSQAGDIDNKLKTLFDSLAVPQANQLPPGSVPTDDHDPFYCVLEDDKLVADVEINTRQLLVPVAHPTEVVLLIDVNTKITHRTRMNDFLS